MAGSGAGGRSEPHIPATRERARTAGCSHGTPCPRRSDDDPFPPSRTRSAGCAAALLSAQAHLAGQRVAAGARPCPASHPWPHTICRTCARSSRLVARGRHRANPLCTRALGGSTQPEGPQGSPRRPGPQALAPFRHPSNLIPQLRPTAVLCSRLPGGASSSGHASGCLCPAPASPRTYAPCPDPPPTKHLGRFANTPPPSNPPHQRSVGAQR